MPISAVLQFSGRNTTTCSSFSTRSLVDFGKKGLWSGKGTSFPISCNRLLWAALSLDVDSHQYMHAFGAGAFFEFQDTGENGSLSTFTRIHTPLPVQRKAVQVVHGEEASSSQIGCMVKNNAKDCDRLLPLDNTKRKHRRRHANSGRAPWNKGLQHSEETKELIRARTREAMEDPMLREKIRERVLGSTQSFETKLKIKTAIRSFWKSKKAAQKRQESCLKEWEEMIADAARRGNDGDEVYQWDSYIIIWRELNAAWKRQQKVQTESKSADHRAKISRAIAAKWADPNYRKNVVEGVRGSLLNRGAKENHRKKTGTKQSASSLGDDDGTDSMSFFLNKRLRKAYKDPLTQNKLEKLVQMRASRLSMGEKKWKDLTQRARILMAEAKRAASALEVAAVKDKNALGPLRETRRLLAEAARSFETVGLGIDGLDSVLFDIGSIDDRTCNDTPSKRLS